MRWNCLNYLPAMVMGLAMTMSGAAFAEAVTETEIGGVKMYSDRTIVENAVNSPKHKTLVAALKAAGLVDTLNSKGPFTVFAPTDDAFENLPEGTVESLLEPENKDKLKAVLTYHVVPGRLDAGGLQKRMKQNGGPVELKTVNGATLTITKTNRTDRWDYHGHKYFVTDQAGNTGSITTNDVHQSNGVIHVVDTVFMPSWGMLE